MPEIGETSVEVAHHLGHGGAHDQPHSRLHSVLEVVEAIVLALVAITTAWSGYQAALWDGHQSLLYEQSTKLRVQSQGLEVQSNQEQMYDAATVVEWLKAQAHGDTILADLFERRLLPEFRPAFEAWKKTDPIHNPNAPAGPTRMPEYHNTTAERAASLNQQASEIFEQGTQAREWADKYVRMTVILATILLLTAISQRFRSQGIRIGLIVIAFLLLCIPIWSIFTRPRA
ncbi:MAG: hypothetical protein WBW31_15955 [Candidatus Sulfotelmatobacter sp.]